MTHSRSAGSATVSRLQAHPARRPRTTRRSGPVRRQRLRLRDNEHVALHIACLTIDAEDCQELGRFWAAALDWEMVKVTEENTYLVPKEGKDYLDPRTAPFPVSGP